MLPPCLGSAKKMLTGPRAGHATVPVCCRTPPYNAYMLVPIGVAVKELGVHPDALRSWEAERRIEPPERTPGGRRRYDLARLRHLTRLKTRPNLRSRKTKALSSARNLAWLGRTPASKLAKAKSSTSPSSGQDPMVAVA